MYAGFVDETKAEIEAARSTNMSEVSLWAGALALAASTPFCAGDICILGKIGSELWKALPDDERRFRSEYEEDCEEEEEELEPEKCGLCLMLKAGEDIDNRTLTDDQKGWLYDSFTAMMEALMTWDQGNESRSRMEVEGLEGWGWDYT